MITRLVSLMEKNVVFHIFWPGCWQNFNALVIKKLPIFLGNSHKIVDILGNISEKPINLDEMCLKFYLTDYR